MENSDVQVKSLKDVLGDASCYIGNFAELTEKVGDQLVEDADGKVILDFNGGKDLIQTIWDQTKETALECAGKELEIRLPDGLTGNLIQVVLAAIGFKL